MKGPADVDARVRQSREKLIQKMRSHVADNYYNPDLMDTKGVKVYQSHVKNPQVFGPHTPLAGGGGTKSKLGHHQPRTGRNDGNQLPGAGSALTDGAGHGRHTRTSPEPADASGRDELNETGHFARPKSSIERQAPRQSSFLNHR